VNTNQSGIRNDVIFVYDDECPICSYAAHATRIQNDIGDLHLIDARANSDHPILNELRDNGLDLDDGMVLKYKGKLYHGQKALMLMARLGARKNWFNRMNSLLFQGETLSRIGYPPMRAIRNLLLRMKGVPKLNNLETNFEKGTPLFQKIFGEDWHKIPPVFHAHYAPRPGTSDRVKVEGILDVKVSHLVSVMSRLTGALIPYSGKDVPVTVTFWCGEDSNSLHFDRAFHYADHGTCHFRSKMVHTSGNELIEFIKFDIGWRLTYQWQNEKVILKHRGYVWRLFGLDIPIPLNIILGKGYAEETAISDKRFHMWTHANHPLFGEMLHYTGEFQITEVKCETTS